MTCTRCSSDNLSRSRRRSLADHARAFLGSWPYRCNDCDLRFWAAERRTASVTTVKESSIQGANSSEPNCHDQSGFGFRAYAKAAETAETVEDGPEIAFRTDDNKPQAKIVVQADSHEQLNHILLALNQAVMSYQGQKQGQPDPETADLRR